MASRTYGGQRRHLTEIFAKPLGIPSSPWNSTSGHFNSRTWICWGFSCLQALSKDGSMCLVVVSLFLFLYYSVRCAAQWFDNHILYRVVPWHFKYPLHPHSYYNITDYIPYTDLLTPWLFCNFQFVLLNPFTVFTQLPTPSYLVTIKIFSISMTLFPFCLFMHIVLPFLWTLFL